MLATQSRSKRFFKKDTQRFSSAKATDQTECHKYGKKGHFERDCWSKTSVPSYQSPFLQKTLNSSQNKPELWPSKDFEAKYNKVKAKLALLNDEEVSSDDNEMVEVKVLMALDEENDVVSKEGEMVNGEQIPSQKKRILGAVQLTGDPSSSGQKDLIFVKSSADDTKVSIPGVERPWLSKDEADESLVCSTPLPPLKKLNGAEPISGPKTIKLILKSKSTFKAKTLKGVIMNESSSAPFKDRKSSSASKINLALAGKLKSVKIKDDLPLAIVMKELNNLKLQFSKNQSSYSRNTQPQQCDIRKPIWYLDSVCSRHMTGVKSYLYKYVEQPGPKIVFGDDSTCTTEGYGSIKCNGIVFTKVAYVNGLKYNLISISQLCDAKYIVQFDE
ncbi:retrovirus-related pol polyprotein from transposon TNT 1-94 [Tanacetum coccineum]